MKSFELEIETTITTYIQVEANTSAEAKKKFDEDEDTREEYSYKMMKYWDSDGGVIKACDEVRYARKCDTTGEGMNEGYCWGEGEQHTKYRKDVIKELRADIENGMYHAKFMEQYYGTKDPKNIPHKDWDNDRIFNWGFDLDMFYWTTWEAEDGEWYDFSGNEYTEDV